MYVVKKGKNPGIYDTWDECKNEVLGFSGADYKKVKSRKEAEKILNGKSFEKTEDQPETKKDNDLYEWSIKKSFEANTVIAYVDGSNRTLEPHNLYSGAAIIVNDGKVIKRIFDYGQKPGLAAMRNVAGELVGAIRAIDYAKKEKTVKKIILIHDYLGISKWANKEWKRKNEYTRNYANYVSRCRKTLDIQFKHVKGHSGNKLNNEADALCGYIAEMVKNEEKFSLDDFIKNYSVLENEDSELGNLKETFKIKCDGNSLTVKLYENDLCYICLIGSEYMREFKKEDFNKIHFSNFVKKLSSNKEYREKWLVSK